MTLQPHTPVSRQCHEKHSSYDGSNLQSTGGRALTLFCSMTPGGVSQRRFIGGGGGEISIVNALCTTTYPCANGVRNDEETLLL